MRHLATSISDVMYNAACVGGCASSFTSSSTARVRRIVAGGCDVVGLADGVRPVHVQLAHAPKVEASHLHLPVVVRPAAHARARPF